MTAHLPVLPVVIPLLLGAACVLIERKSPRSVGAVSLLATVLQLGVALMLLTESFSGHIDVYLLSNWAAPFGIVFAVDRLTTMMLTLTALLGVVVALWSRGGDDRRGPHFHAFLQFQLMGLNGAFLTGDLFNLFVFFEVLLASSYALLLHGAGTAQLRASVHYIVFNLVGGALFLVAASMIYGLTGTLNLADLMGKLAALGPADAALARAAAGLLILVFAIKAALLPLYFWLPATYGSATAPVAALFAIMTKVGVYAILRVSTLLFVPGPLDGLVSTALPVLGLATLGFAAIGALAATRLASLLGYLVVGSAGTLLVTVGLGDASTIAAGLVYLVNSTLVAAGAFLVLDRVRRRPDHGDTLDPSRDGAPVARARGAGLFLLFAIGASGLPPLAGFFGKALVLKASLGGPWTVAVWSVTLITSLLVLVSLARAGVYLFWKPSAAVPNDAPALGGAEKLALTLVAALVVGTSALAGPITSFAETTAAQLLDRGHYVEQVLAKRPVDAAWPIRAELEERLRSGGEK
jgi:multicomponent K+:H+ antiporter subunit D